MKTMTRILTGLMLVLLSTGPAAAAATITIVNVDGANEGFNDPTPAAPVGGNPGTTVGQQRLNVFQHAANIWGGILTSPVPIFVTAQFNPQTCTPTQAVLGSAGATFVFRDFPGAEFAAHWYHSALADRRTGVELNPGFADINATFNSNLNGNPGCLGGRGWYYGYDGLEGTNVELLPVVLHEIGHGLGFSTFVNGSSGTKFNGFDDIYMHYLLDNVTGQRWPTLTNAQRVASIISGDKLVWDGPEVFNQTPDFLGPRQVVRVTTPPLGILAFGAAAFGPPVGATSISGELVQVDDGVAPINDGCSAPVNSLAGKIALVDRGLCGFAVKTAIAQAAGAIAVVVANNAPGPPIGMTGVDPSITIPTVMVSQADGNTLKANLPGVMMTLESDPVLLSGADATGKPMMFAPNPRQAGSSTSHWDISAFPNLLMEPAINANLSSTVDLTHAHFVDIGWNLGPDCSNATASIAGTWPPDHQLLPVTILGVTDPDGDALTITATSVTQDEALDAAGSGNTCPDAAIEDGVASVRIERAGAGDGRVYTIAFTATDPYGHSCTGSVTVGIPHDDLSGPAVDSGQDFSSLGPCKSARGAGNDVVAADVLDLRLVGMESGTALVEYSLPSEGEISLEVFDVAGRKVAAIANGIRAAGTHGASWSPGRIGQGVYFYRLVTPQGTIKKSILHIN